MIGLSASVILSCCFCPPFLTSSVRPVQNLRTATPAQSSHFRRAEQLALAALFLRFDGFSYRSELVRTVIPVSRKEHGGGFASAPMKLAVALGRCKE
jgi:hypothetical protein